MKKNKYTVTFIEGDNVRIYANTATQAFFLAVARKIDEGLSYGVDSIYDESNKRFFVTKKDSMQNLLKELI